VLDFLIEAQVLRHSLSSLSPLNGYAKTPCTCEQVLKVEPALWTLVEVESVEPTNNAAERTLRKAVIWRDLSYGSWSLSDSEFVKHL
jgi:hypothetical protein